MKDDKKTKVLYLIGIVLMTAAVFLNRYPQVPDVVKGISFGVGFGLMILFVVRTQRAKKRNV